MSSTSSSSESQPLEDELSKILKSSEHPADESTETQGPKKKVPKTMSACSCTKRQKQRIVFLPLMILLLVVAAALVVAFELQCASSLKTAESIKLNYVPFYILRGCYTLVLLFMLAAALSSLPLKKPNEFWAFTFSVGVIIVWTVSVFVGSHYHSQVSRLYNMRFSPIRQESFDKIVKKTYNKFGEYNTTLQAGKNLTEIRPTTSKTLFKAVNEWLDSVQPVLKCCGINGYEDYNRDLRWTFDSDTGVTGMIPDAKKRFGLRDKHVLNKLGALGEIPDVRPSCCKKNTKENCNFNIFDTIPPRQDDIYTRGCRLIIYDEFNACLNWFWVAANIPIIIGVPATILAYMFTRHAQGVKFTDCGEVRRKSDDGLYDLVDEHPSKSSDNANNVGSSKKSGGKVAPMNTGGGGTTPSGTAIYRVIEHIPPGQVRKSRELSTKPKKV